MSRFHSYINSAAKLIGSYEKGKPLSLHVRSFFAAEKKFGSKDRKHISSLCYGYFRTGRAFPSLTIQDKMLRGLFLCENGHNEMLAFFMPELDEKTGLAISEKLAILGIRQHDIFPCQDEISPNIDKQAYINTLFEPPPVYLRIRPGRKDAVISKLEKAVVPYKLVDEDAVMLEQHTDAGAIIDLDKDAVVQDLNSQRVLRDIGDWIAGLPVKDKYAVWDCCAASGGKSILLYDRLKGRVELTVSDIRKNILANLSARFRKAGIRYRSAFTADLTAFTGLPPEEDFDILLCDAPCTGSGTWSRTPEQIAEVDEQTISSYAERQKAIIANTLPHVKDGGLYVYITCSVFTGENEEAVTYIRSLKPDWELLAMNYLEGCEMRSDSMFVAAFRATVK